MHHPTTLALLSLAALLPPACQPSPPATASAPPSTAIAPPAPALPGDPVAAAAVAADGAPKRSGEELPPPGATVDDAGLRFTDVTVEAGIDFRYTFGDYAYDNILESSGSGVSWFDADNDGRLDLFFANGTYLEGVSDPKGKVFAGARDAFYHNEGNGRFRDVTAPAGLGDAGWTMAAVAADYDGDGFVDVFLASYGPNRLLHNDGDGTFTDVTAHAGLAGPEKLNGFTKWSAGGSWLDVDHDGRLDLLVCDFLAFDPAHLHPGKEWEMPDPKEYGGQPSLLYHQEADGIFTEITEKTGLFRPDSKCMGLTVLDLDGDGWLDVFQANDHQPNFLFRARGDGTFEEIGWPSGVAVNDAGLTNGQMHGIPGDVDGDGLVDLLVVDLAHGSLYRRTGPLTFDNATGSSGLAALLDGLNQWGAGLQDFDDDGDLDLFTTNGVAYILVEQPPVLAVNDGHGHFRDARATAGAYFRGRRSGRGAAFADFDDDGDVDIVVSHVDYQARPALLRNDTPRRGRSWVGFGLRPARGQAAPGAQVTLEAGGRTQVRPVQPNSSYLSQNDPRVHFGLGPLAAGGRAQVTVRWPWGKRETWPVPALDRYWTIVEGSDRLQ